MRFVIAALAALLIAPAVAPAKQITKVKLCGRDACFTFDRGNSGNKLELFVRAGALVHSPRRSAPFYRLTTYVREPDGSRFSFRNRYVPSADALRAGHRWYAVNDEIRPVLRNRAARLKPFIRASRR